MKKFIFTILFSFLLSVIGRGQVIDDSFYSNALGETKAIDVYLPPGYYNNPNQYYPVIYFLHGWNGTENSATAIISTAASLISNGIIDPVIIVGPNNNSDPFQGSFYINSTINGDYEDYSIVDVINHIESNYRAYPHRNYRTLMGQSMGGYGCFRLGILHKELFRAIAAHGSPINFDFVINDAIDEIIGENSPGPPYTYDYENTGIFTKMIFAMSAAFTPNPLTPQTYLSPQVVEFPVDDQSGLIDSVYQKWKPFDPVSFVNTLLPSDSLAILFGDGSNDNLHLYPGNIAFKDTLDSLGLDYEFFTHTGYHAMPASFRERGLKFLDSIMPPPGEVYCLDPSNLEVSNITQSSADFSWSENWNTNQWNVLIGTTDFDTTAISPTQVLSKPYSITGLLPNTTYEFYVQALCSIGGTSDWVGPFGFTTKCEPASGTLFEDFESETTLPDCWFDNTTNDTVKIEVVDSLSNSGINSVVIYGDFISYGFFGLSSPPLSELGSSTVEVQFSARTYSKPSVLYLGTMENPEDTTSWSCIDTITLTNQFQNFRLKIDTLSAGNNQYVTLRYPPDTAYIFVDDFSYKLSDKKINGTFNYYNNPKTPLSELSLTLLNGSMPVETTTTDVNGYYEFQDIPNGNYTIEVSSSIAPGGVNALDAGKVLLWWTNQSGIERVRWNAGDVNEIGNINSTDPSAIQQHFVYGTQFERGEWTYWKQNDIISSNNPTSTNEVVVNEENVLQNFFGLCVGDFKGDFIPNTSQRDYQPEVSLILDEAIHAKASMGIELPVKVKSAMELSALSLIIELPSKLIEVEDVVVGTGDFPIGKLDYNVKGNELRISWIAGSTLDLDIGSTLLTLKLKTSEIFSPDEEINPAIKPNRLNQLANKEYEPFQDASLITNKITFSPTEISEIKITQGATIECYPNPLNTYTQISYSIPADGDVILEVYNIRGTLVKTLVSKFQKQGKYSIKYNPENTDPGIYSVILHVNSNGNTISRALKIVNNSN